MSMDQERPPGSVGRVSVRLTPVAVPAPLFLMVTVKPIWSPAETGLASAVLNSWMSAQLTVTEALALLLAVAPGVSLVAEMVAVLVSVVHTVLSLVAITWTVWLSSARSVVGVNTRLPATIEK